MADSAASFADNGHTLIRADAELPFVMCTRCGSWGNRRTRGLGQRCSAPTMAGQQAIKRVLAGSHPILQRAAPGAPAHRERVSIVAACDAVGGTWTSLRSSRGDGNTGEAAAAANASDGPEVQGATVPCSYDGADYAMFSGDDDERIREYPPSVADDAMDETDIFGHGGNLDEHSPGGGDGADGDGGATILAAEPLPVDTGGATATRRKRNAPDAADGHVDYVARAVQRLGATLRRTDTNPRERMRRLRQRVIQKETEVEPQRRPAPVDLPSTTVQRGCKRSAPAEELSAADGEDRGHRVRHRDLDQGRLRLDAPPEDQGGDAPRARGHHSLDLPPIAQGSPPRDLRQRGGTPRDLGVGPVVDNGINGRNKRDTYRAELGRERANVDAAIRDLDGALGR